MQRLEALQVPAFGGQPIPAMLGDDVGLRPASGAVRTRDRDDPAYVERSLETVQQDQRTPVHVTIEQTDSLVPQTTDDARIELAADAESRVALQPYELRGEVAAHHPPHHLGKLQAAVDEQATLDGSSPGVAGPIKFRAFALQFSQS
jgi:hypothetical protein